MQFPISSYFSIFLCSENSLLGQGYKLDQLLRVAEETNKIRASRRATMKGTKWEKFRKVLDSATSRFGPKILPQQQDKVSPRIVAGRSA